MPTYSLYGLRISTDRPLDGLEPSKDGAEVDVEVKMVGALPVEEALPEPVRWSPQESFYTYFRLDEGTASSGAYLRLHYADEHTADFVIGPGGRKIWVGWSEGAPFHDINTLLQGPILGRTLRRRGTQVLHAGAIAVDDRIFCLVGNKGAGKSTTTAAFSRRGYPVLTDDLAALRLTKEGALVHPGLARIRLRPDVVEDFEVEGSLKPIWSKDYPNQKYYLDLSGEAAVSGPLPLAAVYVLGARTPATETRIESVPPAEAMLELVAYSYANSVLNASQRAAQFMALGKLAATVPVRRVHRGEGIDEVPGICDAIIEDMRCLAAPVQ